VFAPPQTMLLLIWFADDCGLTRESEYGKQCGSPLSRWLGKSLDFLSGSLPGYRVAERNRGLDRIYLC
jgi:hypothetical protein